MRQLLGSTHPVDPDASFDLGAAYVADRRPARPDRPWLVLNMVVSIDGATAVEGRSGGLGSPADHTAFVALRSVADVILVGAATVRAEHYGPPRTSAAHQAQRVDRGQTPFPRLAVVSGRLDLDLTAPLFIDSPTRPLVVTAASAEPARLAEVGQVAEVVAVGQEHADLQAAVAALRGLGAGVVLCEGGPTLNAQLLAHDLVDEVCVTVAPVLAGGTSKRMIAGPAPDVAATLTLDRVIEDEGTLLLRYVRPI